MKALSVRQPWATLIACGEKTVECRSWKTSYRGPLLICASKGDSVGEDGLVCPGGVALAVVNLVDVRPMTRADLYAAVMDDLEPEDQEEVLKGYAWHLKLQYAVVPFPVKGKLNIYEVDAPLQKLPEQYENHADYLYKTQGIPPQAN